MHTHFLSSDYESALEAGRDDFGYGLALSLAMLGRSDEAIALLNRTEPPKSWRLGRLYVTSLRALLEGKRAESLQGCRLGIFLLPSDGERSLA